MRGSEASRPLFFLINLCVLFACCWMKVSRPAVKMGPGRPKSHTCALVCLWAFVLGIVGQWSVLVEPPDSPDPPVPPCPIAGHYWAVISVGRTTSLITTYEGHTSYWSKGRRGLFYVWNCFPLLKWGMWQVVWIGDSKILAFSIQRCEAVFPPWATSGFRSPKLGVN